MKRSPQATGFAKGQFPLGRKQVTSGVQPFAAGGSKEAQCLLPMRVVSSSSPFSRIADIIVVDTLTESDFTRFLLSFPINRSFYKISKT